MKQELKVDEKRIICSFCEAEVIANQRDEFSWSWGKQGEIGSFIPVSGYKSPEIKNACIKELCRAKLLVWVHS